MLGAFRLVGLLLVSLFAAGCGGESGAGGNGERGALRINLGAEPPSLDPHLLTDTISANILLNISDPLVRLDDDLEPQPALAERWDVSGDGKTVTFHLRDDGTWTNGDRVTARDFEYAWKRILDPKLAAGYAYQLFGVAGAAEYNSCKKACQAVREKVGVRAVDHRTLEVRLTSQQPWFLKQVAHTAFLAVPRATVERHGRKWTEPQNIVTNGPFRLTAWKHDESLTLEKWDGWRAADTVELERVEARMINDATTALQAFEAGELDACLEDSCIPAAEVERLAEGDEYVKVPGLAVQYYGVNVKKVPDVNVRRALARALDRRSIVENVTRAGEVPATSFTPEGMPGFDVIKQDYLPESADLAGARDLLANASNRPQSLNIFYPGDGPNQKDLAIATQAMWKELGIDVNLKGMEWAQFLEFLGPPPSSELDLYLIGWVGDFVDDINFLELWTCGNGNNFTNYCDSSYDELIASAKQTPDNEERFELYAEAESLLTGPDGAFPIIPIHWPAFITLRKTNVEGWEPNLLDQYDLTKVRITED